ncbi:MAG TPA: histidine phosphatase family protein [Steroidobacteraceae bacterium]|jgi:broad specificity phosphatase PhoE|nr:histidine phosphatase family protein [Steroidobacteraceae bacterium]
MPRIYLVRHAKPAAAWGDDPDPGLDALGATQATAAARHLAKTIARASVYTSPLRRCRETAQSLCELWQYAATVLPSVAEIPSPPIDSTARREWLTAGMRGTWRELHERAPPGSIDYLQWRRSVVDALLAMPHDCVIYTHYIAINVAVGAAQERDDVLCFRPDHASVTVLDAVAGRLQLVELGREATTDVLTR